MAESTPEIKELGTGTLRNYTGKKPTPPPAELPPSRTSILGLENDIKEESKGFQTVAKGPLPVVEETVGKKENQKNVNKIQEKLEEAGKYQVSRREFLKKITKGAAVGTGILAEESFRQDKTPVQVIVDYTKAALNLLFRKQQKIVKEAQAADQPPEPLKTSTSNIPTPTQEPTPESIPTPQATATNEAEKSIEPEAYFKEQMSTEKGRQEIAEKIIPIAFEKLIEMSHNNTVLIIEEVKKMATDPKAIVNLTTATQESKKIISEAKKNILLILEELNNNDMSDENIVAFTMAVVKRETGTFIPKKEDIDEKEAIKKYNGPYYGRGFIQLTWLENYTEIGKRINYDLVKDPDTLIRDPKLSAKVLVDYIKYRGIDELAKKAYFTQARQKVNPNELDELTNQVVLDTQVFLKAFNS